MPKSAASTSANRRRAWHSCSRSTATRYGRTSGEALPSYGPSSRPYGERGAGARFPAVVDLASEFDVAASTIQKAVAALRTEGKLRTVLGQGSFVVE
ncbi:GntR family transcriptional regulator [Streptomyces ipomoeae]|uniref:GntR family transcriptional regulator n=1 Tax=Streptomyces ipomoeae TaxID=103232 RepID=A0A540P3D6_9ACTN|nr:GntR family transcriptional regulator [Streptomyces ipomoeae]TQE26054.1 GntR family transcriptional regulator [Streptomyces ipomoeae]TQE31080.1 GntR family transcriptional regulator [Streptomyces ipomoeae]